MFYKILTRALVGVAICDGWHSSCIDDDNDDDKDDDNSDIEAVVVVGLSKFVMFWSVEEITEFTDDADDTNDCNGDVDVDNIVAAAPTASPGSAAPSTSVFPVEFECSFSCKRLVLAIAFETWVNIWKRWIGVVDSIWFNSFSSVCRSLPVNWVTQLNCCGICNSRNSRYFQVILTGYGFELKIITSELDDKTEGWWYTDVLVVATTLVASVDTDFISLYIQLLLLLEIVFFYVKSISALVF